MFEWLKDYTDYSNPAMENYEVERQISLFELEDSGLLIEKETESISCQKDFSDTFS